jgi:rSAM/selenodomain-associated transferase 1
VKYPDARLLLLSKAPDPGQVKTRLIPVIGAVGAAELYEDLLCSSLEMAVNSGLSPVDLWCSPTMAHPFFQQCRQRYGVELREQIRGNLGRRMAHALESASQSSQPLVLIGADCPALSADDLEEAFTLLDQGSEVVLGPAEDGGYYLIGMRGLYPFVFDDVPWSTSTVLDLTQTRLNNRGVKWQCLPPHRDLDTVDDYRAWLESGGNLSKRFRPRVS